MPHDLYLFGDDPESVEAAKYARELLAARVYHDDWDEAAKVLKDVMDGDDALEIIERVARVVAALTFMAAVLARTTAKAADQSVETVLGELYEKLRETGTGF